MRRFVILFAAVMTVFSANAQEKSGIIRKIYNKIVSPSVMLDPEAIYQPEARWTVALTGNLRQASIIQKNDFMVMPIPEEGLIVITDKVPARIVTSLEGGVSKGLGLQVGYGNLSLSFSKTFQAEGTNKLYAFDYLSAGHAVQFQFFNLVNPAQYSLALGERGTPDFSHISGVTENPGQMRAILVDAFYAFNRRTFAFSAAYKGNKFQRYSAGSWMFGSKLIMGEFSIDPSEKISIWNSGQAKQRSAQVSFGGGYSYNFVPLHRQPTGERDKGLRNLTINLTFLPMVTLFNQFTTEYYVRTIDNNYDQYHKSVMNGKLLVNYVGRVGIGYSYDLFTINLSASNDSFAYKGTSSLPYIFSYGDEDALPFISTGQDVETNGIFSRWTVALRLGMRF